MPSTLNTVGTHYYGTRNAFSREATCPHCHRPSVLTSYDTRLYFVVLFIPIIPLGRKHIIDQCKHCTQHYALPLKKWEAQRQQEVTTAAARFAALPTPEKAMELHTSLIQYLEFTKAAEFRELMLAKFPDHAEIHEYLGLALSRLNEDDAARQHMERAFALNPELRVPRVNVALWRIVDGKPDEARELLAFLLQPGAGKLYALEPLFMLAKSLATHHRPAEALEIYRHMLREQPALGQNADFRQSMAQVERATGEKTSTLPKKQLFQSGGSKRKAIGAAVVVALVIVGLVVGNEYVRRHRTLYFVNGFDQALEVDIPGQPAVQVRPHDFRQLTLPEGDYVARVSGAIQETIPVSMHTGYFARWGDQPMWVLNPGGAEILERATAIYSRLEDERGSTAYYYGERFLLFPDVEHPFAKLPERMMLKKSERKELTSVNRFEIEPALLHEYFRSSVSLQEARRFAESRLTLAPEDEALLLSYIHAVRNPEDLHHVKAFLKAGLGRRPVVVPWHRQHQALQRGNGREDALRAEYDALVAAEPNDPALLYLRGLISPSQAEAQRFHEQARSIDPQHPYVLLAQAVTEVAQGDLAAALPRLEASAKKSPQDIGLVALRDAVRLAQGQGRVLLAELRAKLKRNPWDRVLVSKLAEVLVASGQPRDALREVGNYLSQLKSKEPAEVQATAEMLRYRVHHLAGDFAQAEKVLEGSTDPATEGLRFTLLLDQLKPAEAMAMDDAESFVEDDVAHLLAVSIAWQLTGDPTKAAEARDDAAVIFEEGDSEQRRAGAMLTAKTPPTPAELDALVLDPAEKSALCVALGQKFPGESARCFALARKLNFIRLFPYHIINRATQPVTK